MPGFTNRLAEARNSIGLTQQQVADSIGCTLQAYQNYEYGKRDIKGSVLSRLSETLGKSVNYILGLEDSEIHARSATRQIPVLGRIAAGTPREAIAQSEEVWWLLDPTLSDRPDLFYLRVSGDSMDRLFPDGSLVLVDPCVGIVSGDVVVIFVNGDDATVKRVFFAGDTVVLHPESHNPAHHDRSIDQTDPDAPDVRIVGKVISYTAPMGWRA